jgi:hypothetical protein
MKREVKNLKQRALNSLVLCIELFNRPQDEGRAEAVLIHADHAFELLLKAIIRHRGGRIRRPRETRTIGLGECVAKCLSDGTLKCLDDDQATSIRLLNGWRDAAQHYFLVLSEMQLYLVTQGAVTLTNDLLQTVFSESLATYVPDRVLPVSTQPPTDLHLMLDNEFDLIRQLITTGSRRTSEAKARLRSVAILESATKGGEAEQPSEAALRRTIRDLRSGRTWKDIFPGVASFELQTSGTGLTYSLRLTKKDGLPVSLAAETGDLAAVIAVKRVNELDFYQFGFEDLAKRLSDFVSRNRLVAVVQYLRLQESEKYFKEITIGQSKHRRYSQDALTYLREALQNIDVDEIWRDYLTRRRMSRQAV